ncbi:MAG: exo-alpha-sialidase, partial [Gemmatimonadota bacterium]|nr:exo-alpha-sialidase [Gemmatimonadota bacterium]
GQTFEQLTTGLPQQHAYDIVYRHALAVDKSGTRLAFGTTTGSLFVSTNGGDKWITVSNHLPPVYAVRFA